MSNEEKLAQAENSLASAIDTLRDQVEIIPEDKPDIEVEVDEPQPEKKPRRSEFVEVDDPKVKARIDDLYSQVKKSDQRNQLFQQHNLELEKKLSETLDRLEKFERATKDTASNQVETELKTKLRAAREIDDFDTIQEIEDKLLDLRLERRIAEKVPPKVQEKPKEPAPQEREFIEKAKYIELLSQERDEHGNILRPYLYDWHPDNAKASELARTIPQEFAAAGKEVNIKTIMEVIDERLRGKKQPQGKTVLSTDENDTPPRKTMKITQEEAYAARRLGITPEAYARQKQLIAKGQ